MGRAKDVLTTGEVARICKVAPRTVSKWFDTGQLRGYRIPGSKDRRIPLEQLIRFMRAHGIPLNGLEGDLTRVLIVEDQLEMADLIGRALAHQPNYDVHRAGGLFEAGAAAERLRPHVMLVSCDMNGVSPRTLVRAVRGSPDQSSTKLVAMTSSSNAGQVEALKQEGFDAVLVKPFDWSEMLRVIETCLEADTAHQHSGV